MQNIQEVIALMKASENNYILDYSNLLFETWLVMHFQNLEPDKDNSKRVILKLMRDYLNEPQKIKCLHFIMWAFFNVIYICVHPLIHHSDQNQTLKLQR